MELVILEVPIVRFIFFGKPQHSCHHTHVIDKSKSGSLISKSAFEDSVSQSLVSKFYTRAFELVEIVYISRWEGSWEAG